MSKNQLGGTFQRYFDCDWSRGTIFDQRNVIKRVKKGQYRPKMGQIVPIFPRSALK